MKKTFTFLFTSLFFSQFLIAQGSIEKAIRGQIVSETIPLEGVNVTNVSNNSTVVSDSYGNFSIPAKEGDIISFLAVGYEPLRKYIGRQHYNLGTVVVDMTATTIELKEVIVNKRPDISAENLGIIPKDQIKLTSAERKLQTAGDFKPIHLVGLLGGLLAVDPILNAINGRTKMLKKAVSVEKKEALMAKMDVMFEDNYYIESLKIQQEYIKGFQYYCIEDPVFARYLRDKNKTMCMFLLVGLASEYHKNGADGVENH